MSCCGTTAQLLSALCWVPKQLDVGAFDSGDNRVERVAVRNCTDDEVEIQMGGMYLRHAHKGGVDVPADQTSRNRPPCQSWASGEVKQKMQFLLADKKQRNIGQDAESPLPCELEKDIYVFMGDGVDSPDSCRTLHGFPREHSMSNSNRIDRMRQQQLRAFAENLHELANGHRQENVPLPRVQRLGQ